MTLRELLAKLGDEAEQYMDAELAIQVRGSNGRSAWALVSDDWPRRYPSRPETGEKGRLTLAGFTDDRILKPLGW